MNLEVKTGWLAQIEAEILSDGSEVFVASHPELPGVMAQGLTAVEALERFHENVRDYLEDLRARGLPLPHPTLCQARIAFGHAPDPPVELPKGMPSGTGSGFVASIDDCAVAC